MCLDITASKLPQLPHRNPSPICEKRNFLFFAFKLKLNSATGFLRINLNIKIYFILGA